MIWSNAGLKWVHYLYFFLKFVGTVAKNLVKQMNSFQITPECSETPKQTTWETSAKQGHVGVSCGFTIESEQEINTYLTSTNMTLCQKVKNQAKPVAVAHCTHMPAVITSFSGWILEQPATWRIQTHVYRVCPLVKESETILNHPQKEDRQFNKKDQV